MMHPFYRRILEEHYGSMAQATISFVASFYRTLPPPEHLTNEYVRERLKGHAAQTQWCYLSFLKPVEAQLSRPILQGLKPPKPAEIAVSRADLYTKEELASILGACTETRDRAMMAVLYESGFRLIEVTRMNVENVQPEKTLWWLTVVGKRNKERTVPLIHSVPNLEDWMNVHPLKRGALFTTLNAPFSRLTGAGLEQRVGLIIKRAGVRRRFRPVHLFRHTRLTELASMGMSESELCLFAGWELGSPMTKTYIHLSGRDLKRGFSRIMGIKEEEPETKLNLESVKCPRCGTANSPAASFCSQCSLVLDEELALRLTPGIGASTSETLRQLVKEVLREELAESDREL